MTTTAANQVPAATQFLDADSKRAPGEAALVFAELLTAKFADKGQYASNVFTVQGGNRYDRIVQKTASGHQGRVHAFVSKEGEVYKAAGWPAPAKGVRFSSILAAVEASDLYGSYLYR